MKNGVLYIIWPFDIRIERRRLRPFTISLYI